MQNTTKPVDKEQKLWDSWANGQGLEETARSLRRFGHTVTREEVRRYFIKFCDSILGVKASN